MMNWRTNYQTIINQLSVPSLLDEIRKLENSTSHLCRSNDELRVHCISSAEEDVSWVMLVVSDNEEVIIKNTERIQMAKIRIIKLGKEAQNKETMAIKTEDMGKSNGHTGREHIVNPQGENDFMETDDD